MGQNSRTTLIYALVARGTPPVVLAEYTGFSGNFVSIAYQCLQKLPSSNNKFTYNCDNHTFNYLVHDGFSKSVFTTNAFDFYFNFSFYIDRCGFIGLNFIKRLVKSFAIIL